MSNGKSEKAESIATKALELRLASVKEALQRTRSVFIVMTIASAAILFTLWNASFSRERTVAFVGLDFASAQADLSTVPRYCDKLKAAALPITPQQTPETPQALGRRKLVENWYDSRSIHVGLLGIHVSISDLPVIGSFSLVVVTIWFFYAQRRANRSLVSLFRYTQREHSNDLTLRSIVFHEVRNSLLFIKTEENDDPLKGLESESAEDGIFKDEPDIFVDSIKEKRTFTGTVLKLLNYLPFWTIVVVIVRDFLALAMYSPTSGLNLRLGQILWYEMKCNLETNPNLSYLAAGQSFFLMLLFESVAVGCAIYTLYLCRKSSNFSKANKITLQEFGKLLRKTDDPGKVA